MPDSFGTPWTIAFQTSLSMRFPRQEYLIYKNEDMGCHILLQQIFQTQRWNPNSCVFCIGRWIFLTHHVPWANQDDLSTYMQCSVLRWYPKEDRYPSPHLICRNLGAYWNPHFSKICLMTLGFYEGHTVVSVSANWKKFEENFCFCEKSGKS